MNTRILTAALLIALLGAGCSFSSAKSSLQRNACSMDADCTGQAHCKAGLCAMDSTTALGISLQVVPAHAPDSTEALAIPFGPFTLTGPAHRSFELARPVTMSGSVHDGTQPIAASLSFTPVDANGMPTGPAVQASTVDPAAPGEGAFSALLLDAASYHVVVQPMDTTLAPHALNVTAQAKGNIDVDYAKVGWTHTTVVVQGAPSSHTLQLRELDKATGRPLSNTIVLKNGSVVLDTDPGHQDFKLEIAAQDTQPSASAPGNGKSACDATGEVFPVLTANDVDLTQDAKGNLTLTLPAIPAPIRYSGTVQLCAGKSSQGLDGMPMTLDATALRFADKAVTVTAAYNAATTVSVDKASGELRFCTQVLPGDYVVVVTPPANLPCAIFAERRLIETTTGSDYTNEVLTFQKPATLTGTISTSDDMPVVNASIDAVALGRDLALAASDPTVASYNRSKQTTSDTNGMFQLTVDVGSYDVVIKPPAESNFPWQVLHDVDIAARRSVFATRVVVDAPVVVLGTLSYIGGNSAEQRSLAGADVHAYTVVGDGDQARSIEIGHCTADDAGNIMLLVSPTLRDGW